MHSAYDALFRCPEAVDLFSERSHLAAMLRVEAALAQAQAKLGIIPAEAAAVIFTCCHVDALDLPSLAAQSSAAGNLAIPLVQQLTRVIKEKDADASGYVHWGATSQDILDTALVLQLRDHFELLSQTLDTTCRHLAGLAQSQRDTLVAGRTWLQHAVPVTFGLKAAGWLDAFLRHRVRLQELLPRVLTVQFGGAAGTLASLGERGFEVAAAFARELDLSAPSIPWHTERDRLAEVASFHGLLTGTIGKVARDHSLLMQTEIGEVSEPIAEGRGGSSTMPHKRNPVVSAVLLSTSLRVPALVSTMLTAMPQEHERGLGGWHAEWETLPEICTLTIGALDKLASMLPDLVLNPEAMRVNVDMTHGLALAEAVSMALALHTGRERAHSLVRRASARAIEDGISLRAALACVPEIQKLLAPEQMDRLLQPANYLGSTQLFIDHVLTEFRSAFGSAEARP